eukprot:4220382-Alexandrium_andersonii.AAC.1
MSAHMFARPVRRRCPSCSAAAGQQPPPCGSDKARARALQQTKLADRERNGPRQRASALVVRASRQSHTDATSTLEQPPARPSRRTPLQCRPARRLALEGSAGKNAHDVTTPCSDAPEAPVGRV